MLNPAITRSSSFTTPSPTTTIVPANYSVTHVPTNHKVQEIRHRAISLYDGFEYAANANQDDRPGLLDRVVNYLKVNLWYYYMNPTLSSKENVENQAPQLESLEQQIQNLQIDTQDLTNPEMKTPGILHNYQKITSDPIVKEEFNQTQEPLQKKSKKQKYQS